MAWMARHLHERPSRPFSSAFSETISKLVISSQPRHHILLDPVDFRDAAKPVGELAQDISGREVIQKECPDHQALLVILQPRGDKFPHCMGITRRSIQNGMIVG